MTSADGSADFSMDSVKGMMAAITEQNESLQRLQQEMKELRGKGDAADRRVRVEVNPAGALVDLQIDPKAMRLGSEELAKAVLEAARSAMRDADERAEELMRPALEQFVATGLSSDLPYDLKSWGFDADQAMNTIRDMRRDVQP